MQNVVEEVDDEVSTDGEDIDDGGTFHEIVPLTARVLVSIVV